MQGRRMLGAIGTAAVMTLALASCSSGGTGAGGHAVRSRRIRPAGDGSETTPEVVISCKRHDKAA